MPTDTPFAAARNESFCAISSPPRSFRCTGTILPGYGAPKATRFFCPLRFRNTVMNSDSPVRSRLPAPISAPRKPLCCAEPSPKIVSISIPSSMYIIPPASATIASLGSSSASTNCMSSPKILYSISCIAGIADLSCERCRLHRRVTHHIRGWAVTRSGALPSERLSRRGARRGAGQGRSRRRLHPAAPFRTLQQRVQWQLAAAVAQLLDRDVHLVGNRQQQVRCGIALEHQVTPAGHELFSTNQHERQVRMIVRVALAHPGAVEEDAVVEQRAIAVRCVPQLLEIRREKAYVIGVELDDVLDLDRVALVMGERVMRFENADLRI